MSSDAGLFTAEVWAVDGGGVGGGSMRTSLQLAGLEVSPCRPISCLCYELHLGFQPPSPRDAVRVFSPVCICVAR